MQMFTLHLPRIRQAFSILLFVLACGCSPEAPESSAPAQRPASVPAAAVWVGGVDGGVFVVMEPGGSGSSYKGVVFAAQGDVLYRGSFRLEPAGSVFAAADIVHATGWDGDTLYFADGRSLKTRQ